MSARSCKMCGRPTEVDGRCHRHPLPPHRLDGMAPDMAKSVSFIHAFTTAILGKSAMACSADDLHAVNAILQARVAAERAELDRADAALREAGACGCTAIQAPLDESGGMDIGRARVLHSCGRESKW